MSRFSYSALSQQGEALQGWLEAASEVEVVHRLQEQGHIPLAAVIAEPGAGAGLWQRLRRRDALSGAQMLLLTRQLATLLAAGQPLDRALGVLIELRDERGGRRLIERLRERVRGGDPLSLALDAENGVFSRLYVSLVRAGEAGGSLDDSLQRLAGYLERSQTLRGDIINALIYPAFLLAGVLGSLILLLAWVVPQFVPIFADMQVPIPWITRLILGLGTALRKLGWLLPPLLIAALFGWRHRMRQPGQRRRWHAWWLGLRGIGPLSLKLETARLSRSLGTLLHHGVPLLAGLQVAAGVTANLALAAALQQVIDTVRDGGRLGAALAQTGLFPPLAVQMVQVGEEAGQLDRLLLQVADTFDTESRRSIDRLLSALVPTLTLVMTVLVAIIMAAILMPLLSLTSQIQ